MPQSAKASGLFCRRRCNVCAVPVVANVVEVPVAVAQFVPIQVPTYSVTYQPQVVQQTSTTVTHQNYVQQQSVVQEDLQLNALLAEARECQARLAAYQQQVRPALTPLEQCQKELAELKALMTKMGQANGSLPIPVPSVVPTPPVAPPGTPPVVVPPTPPAGNPPPAKPPDTGPMALGVFNKSCAACHDSKVAATNGKGFTLLQDGKIAPLNANQLVNIMTKTYLQEMPKQPNKVGIKPLTDEEVGAIVAWVKEQK